MLSFDEEHGVWASSITIIKNKFDCNEKNIMKLI